MGLCRIRLQACRSFEVKCSLIIMSDPLKQSSVNEVEFAVVGFETQGRLHVRHRCIELGLPGQRNSETCMRLRIFRIELERELVLFDRFVQAAFLLQGRGVIKMWFCAHWNIRDYPCLSLHFGNSTTRPALYCSPRVQRRRAYMCSDLKTGHWRQRLALHMH